MSEIKATAESAMEKLDELESKLTNLKEHYEERLNQLRDKSNHLVVVGNMLRMTVRDFFVEAFGDESEVTLTKKDVNELLNDINAELLTTAYRVKLYVEASYDIKDFDEQTAEERVRQAFVADVNDCDIDESSVEITDVEVEVIE